MILTVKDISRISRIQEKRLIIAGILSVFSVIYMCVNCMALYIHIPMWLVVINFTCLFFNLPIIYWILSLYVEQRKKINNSIK